MSWESSVVYERIINETVRERLGGVHSADLLIRSYDFAEIERLQAAGDWHAAGRLLGGDAALLETAGADAIVLCTNTMHTVAEAIEAAISIPLLHIADVTADAVTSRGVDTVALLGTRYTMEQAFLRERLAARHAVEVLIPDASDRVVVHDVIYDELVRGEVRDSSRKRYLEIIERLIDRGAGGVVSGCTEIELLVDQRHLNVPFFPTSQLHAVAAAEFALGDS